MFQKIILALSVALSLGGALTAQAANPPPVRITYLPFNITAPGTYVVAEDLHLLTRVIQGEQSLACAIGVMAQAGTSEIYRNRSGSFIWPFLRVHKHLTRIQNYCSN